MEICVWKIVLELISTLIKTARNVFNAMLIARLAMAPKNLIVQMEANFYKFKVNNEKKKERKKKCDEYLQKTKQ